MSGSGKREEEEVFRADIAAHMISSPVEDNVAAVVDESVNSTWTFSLTETDSMDLSETSSGVCD